MRLSDIARELMLKGETSKLLALPFDELICGDDVKNYHALFTNPDMSGERLHSLAPELIDSGAFVIESAVVISSGHIFSKQTIDTLLLYPDPMCPLTREPIVKLPLEEYYIALPVVDEAVSQYRDFISLLRGPLFHDETLEAQLKIDLCNNKFRFIITVAEAISPNAQHQIEASIKKFLPKPDSIIPRASFVPIDYSRAYSVSSKKIILLFSFKMGTLTDADLEKMPNVLFSKLNPRPLELVDEDVVSISIHDLQPKEYKEIFSMRIGTLLEIIKSCEVFLKFTLDLAAQKSWPLTDRVKLADSEAMPSRVTGNAFFGSRTQTSHYTSIGTCLSQQMLSMSRR